jgi:hypothetical protein
MPTHGGEGERKVLYAAYTGPAHFESSALVQGRWMNLILLPAGKEA